MVSACSDKNLSAPPVDINNAASSAQSDISNYAADHVRPTRDPSTPKSPRPFPEGTPAATIGSGDDRSTDPAAAQNLVQSYFRLIEARRYEEARQLWDRDGAASGADAAAFARNFARYSTYKGTTGVPGRVDAGAGQRYVTVPVEVTGRLREGNRAFTLAGTATLHRTAAIDGATPAQRQWRISAMELDQKPDGSASSPTGMPETAQARFTCEDGSSFFVRFDNRVDIARISQNGRVTATLTGQRPASGIWYKAPGWELRGKGRDVDLTRNGQPPRKCRALD